jgi:penicillin-binding protein 2
LDLGLIDESTTFFCSGKIRIYGESHSCWAEQGHGSMNLYSGIRNSCNIYFYQLGKTMGIEEISRYARRLGFEIKTGIDLPNEKTGLVPDRRWKQEVLNEPWQPGETISVSIGQGPLLVTPLQVACHTAIIANRGRNVIPHLLKSPSPTPDNGEDSASSSRQATIIDPVIFEKVIRGMWGSVNDSGTGRAARVEGFDVCGKTGSTQVMSTEVLEKLKAEGKEVKTHSWFTGFGPKDSPRVVVTVIVEFGGMGGATAAPLAREMFELYKKNYD